MSVGRGLSLAELIQLPDRQNGFFAPRCNIGVVLLQIGKTLGLTSISGKQLIMATCMETNYRLS